MSVDGSPWLYYKVYTAGGAAALEWLITHTLPEVVRCGAIDRWFFLRYRDRGGLHLRLRLHTSTAFAATLRETVEPLLKRALEEQPSAPPTRYRPTIPPLNAGAVARDKTVSRLESEEYEPEIDNFGVRGVSIAEHLFQASSEIVMRLLIDERAGRCSRKTLAPILMQDVLDAFPPAQGAPTFWERYARYWLGEDPAQIAAWQPLFMAKAETLRSRGLPVVVPDKQLPEAAVQHVRTWRATLKVATNAYASLDEEPARRHNGELAAHFVHLMNNRLGLLQLEEAYLATLLSFARKSSAGMVID